MASIQSLLEDWKNWSNLQDWKLQKQREEMFGGDYQLAEDVSKWGGGFNPSNIGSGLSGLAGAIKAYHGSPRAEPFERFSKKFMGTGEGAQAFSKGHYVAEQPKVAKEYYRPGGSLYEVSLEWPDAAREAVDPMSREHFFQWDKPFRNQPEHIQKALLDIVKENPPEIDKYREFLKNTWKMENPDIVDFAKMYPNALIRDAQLESHLYKKGIPGVAFADQKTRFKPVDQRTYNYAVYGDEIPRIVSRNNPSILDILGIK